MTPKTFYKSNPRETVERVAVAAGTSFANFQQIALYGGACSKGLAKRLADASGGEMGLEEILFPEDHEEDSAPATHNT